MTEFELGWLTAAIESEGSFYISPNNFIARGEKKLNYLPQVNISNSDLLFLERCQSLISKITGKVRPISADYRGTPAHHKRVRKIIVGNYSEIVSLCDALIPHLFGKQKQAMLVRDLAKLCIGKRGKGIPCDLRKHYYDQVKELNTGHLRESREANTPDAISEAEVVKIESELQSNLQRIRGDAFPPTELVQ